MTDVDADIQMALSLVGYPNSYFYPICEEFAPGLWDNVPCSEIACCISYLAGNLSKIYVSNYAQGLVNLYQANGRFGHIPQPGAFIWFQYGSNTPEHTGRVVRIDNGIVYTVEGNVGGIVQALSYPVNSGLIYGYGYPNYTGQQMDTYEIRTENPAGQNLPYYNTIGSGGWNSCPAGSGPVSGADVLYSDTGYAQGRMIEIHNQLYPNNQITSAAGNIYSIFTGPAQDWYNIAVAQGINVGNRPDYGAIGIWYNSSQNKGHAAVLENYVSGRWEISESYPDIPTAVGSWDYSYLINNTDYLPYYINDPDWILIGFIYPFTVAYPPPGPEPPLPPEPEKKRKLKIWMCLKRLPF